MAESLEDIGRKWGTDKSTVLHHYLNFYERFLSPIRSDVKKVLEIGVLFGQSVKMWRDYFPNAQIVGFDGIDDSQGMDGVSSIVTVTVLANSAPDLAGNNNAVATISFESDRTAPTATVTTTAADPTPTRHFKVFANQKETPPEQLPLQRAARRGTEVRH